MRHGSGAQPIQAPDLRVRGVQDVLHCAQPLHHRRGVHRRQDHGWAKGLARSFVRRSPIPPLADSRRGALRYRRRPDQPVQDARLQPDAAGSAEANAVGLQQHLAAAPHGLHLPLRRGADAAARKSFFPLFCFGRTNSNPRVSHRCFLQQKQTLAAVFMVWTSNSPPVSSRHRSRSVSRRHQSRTFPPFMKRLTSHQQSSSAPDKAPLLSK